MDNEMRGLMAALLTPRTTEGSVDFESLERNADFALSKGVRGIVPCGGTGEYFDLSMRQRQAIVELLVPVARGRGLLIAGVGSASMSDSVSLARHALEAGAQAALLPAPHFYRYGGSELSQYFRATARRIAGPVLLYNLAGFLSPIHQDVAAELLETEPHLIGIKDSSGDLDILRRLTRDAIQCARLQGHDARLADSMREGLLDGAISGPASVVPEMSAALFDTFGNEAAFTRALRLNDEFIAQLMRFPYPWALKWVAGWRGLAQPSLPFPLSAELEDSRDRFRVWFEAWLSRLLADRNQ